MDRIGTVLFTCRTGSPGLEKMEESRPLERNDSMEPQEGGTPSSAVHHEGTDNGARDCLKRRTGGRERDIVHGRLRIEEKRTFRDQIHVYR